MTVRTRMSARRDVTKEVVRDLALLIVAFASINFLRASAGEQCSPHGCFPTESRVDVAMLTAQKLANEAYPEWSMAHPDRVCPTLDELVEYEGRNDSRDPWGRLYELECRGNTSRPTVIVSSRGGDGMRGTFDDISSNL